MPSFVLIVLSRRLESTHCLGGGVSNPHVLAVVCITVTQTE